MKIVFRVDASLVMGAGHIMRCLTLADRITDRCADIIFIIREHPGHLGDLIKRKGYGVYRLSLDEKPKNRIKQETNENILEKRDLLLHHKWLGVSQQQDATDCQPILDSICPDWLIIDHYAIDYRWQKVLKPYCHKLMVIDDLADRKHDCHFLLDQTYGRKNSDYQDLVSTDTTLLLGTQYALLRQEFVQWRNFSLKRKSIYELKHLLITLGGVDAENITALVLNVLKRCEIPKDLIVTVVMGETAPWIEQVKQLAQKMPFYTEVKVNVSNMAELMAKSDLAIGAAGATTWERCCLGLPTIQVITADNQQKIADELLSINAAYCLELHQINDIENIFKHIDSSLPKLSLISRTLSTGEGVYHVVNKMLHQNRDRKELTFKPISNNDCQYLYELQTKSEVRQYFKVPEVPSMAEHNKWFRQSMDSHDKVIFILVEKEKNIGMLRLDGLLIGKLEVSIIIDPDFKGRGFAQKTIKALLLLVPGQTITAVVNSRNIASQRVFEKMGFQLRDRNNSFWCYIKNV